MAQLVRAPARRAGDPGLNPGPGENFSLQSLKRTKFHAQLSKIIVYKQITKSKDKFV